MPLSKIWTKLKKSLVVGFVIAISILVCFLSMHLSGGAAEMLFSEMLEAFSVLAIFGTTLSVALFNYIDSISKDVSALDADSEKVGEALTKLSELKKEVILNAGLILTLLVIELSTRGLGKSITLQSTSADTLNWFLISVRFSIFILAIMAASEQIRGLLVAIGYRNLIHTGKSYKQSDK
jgi:hypothetical protein